MPLGLLRKRGERIAARELTNRKSLVATPVYYVHDWTFLRTAEQRVSYFNSGLGFPKTIRASNFYLQFPASQYPPASAYFFFHSHGGIGAGSAHKPFLASRASLSKPSSTVSPGATTSAMRCTE